MIKQYKSYMDPQDKFWEFHIFLNSDMLSIYLKVLLSFYENKKIMIANKISKRIQFAVYKPISF